MLPVASSVVSTSEELVAAIAAANDGDTITLGEGEFTTYGNTSPEKSLTFVGAGTGTVWTIGDLDKDVGGEGNGDCSFDGCNTVTFRNMTLKSNGADYRGFIRISNTVVENCTLKGKTAYWGYETAKFVNSTFNAPEGDYALWDYSTKAMTFEGCRFNISGKGVNVYVEQPSTDARTVEVNGCTVNSDKAGKAFLNIKNSTQAFDVTLSGTNMVTGLEANGTTGSALYQVETTEVTETTGKPVAVKAKADDGTVTTLYEVKETVEASVAEVNGAKYKSLQAAVDAAKSGATVTLLADTRENVTVSKNAIVLDLNGHTLNGGTENAKPALTVDNKKVTLKDSSEAQTGTIKREDTADTKTSHYVIDIQGKNGFMIVESGKVENNSGIPGVKGSSLIRLGNDSVSGWPTLTIKGGTFTQDNFIAIKVDRGTLHLLGGTVNSANSFAIENWNNAYIKGGTVNGTVSTWVYSTGAAFSKLEISGGTVNGNVASVNYDNAADKQARVYVTGGTVTGTLGTYTYNNGLVAMDETAKATIEVTGGTFSKDPTQYVVENSAITENDDGTFGVAKAYLAKIGDTEYYTMDEAFHAVKAGETIVMLRDYTTNKVQNSGDESFTIDLGGHTWTANIVDTASAAFEINYSDVTLTVKNGKVVSSQLAGLIPSAMGGTIKYDNSTLVFEGVEMTANGHSGIETNGSNTNDTVTLRNSTLNVPNGFGIYFPSSGTLTIDNSVINAKTMGVQVCAGSLNISGADTAITVSGDGIAKTENDGAIEDGAAISIVERTGYKGLDEIKVEGGKFTAKGDNAAVKAYKWENQTASAFDNSKNVVAISGGTFSSAVAKSLCADGFIPTKNEDGTYGVKEGADGYVEDENGNVTISTAEGLFYFAKKVNAGNNFAGKTVTLANNIDLNNEKWTPIGIYGTQATWFKGTFDGQNHAVTGLKVEESRKNGVGFFSKVYTGTIKNLTVEGSVSAPGCTYVGGIVGHGYATITNCTFKGTVSGSGAAQVGGIAGSGGFTVDRCSVYGDVSAGCWAGGIVGNCQDGGAYTNCYVEGTISSESTFWGGGAAGITPVPLYPSQVISGCYSNTVVKVAGEEVNCPIIACYNNPLDHDGYSGGLKIYDNSWNKQKNSNDSYPIYAEKDGKGGVLMEGMTAARDNSLIMLEDDLNYVTGDLSKVRIMAGSSVTQAQIDALAVASVGDSKYQFLAEAIDAAQDGQTVTLLADATEDVVISKSITLELGGKTLTNTNVGKATISVQSGTVTVKNGNVVGGNDYYNIEAKKDANLTLTDVTATAGNTGSSMIDNWGTLTITSGTYTGGLNVVKSEEGSVLNISGGTFTRETAPRWGITGTVLVYGTTTITGGTFNEKSTSTNARVVVTGRVDGYDSITYVKGGTFNGNGNNVFHHLSPAQADDSFEVSGGTFNKSIPDYYCADGFIPTKNAGGTYGVKEGQYVAKVDSKKYETLADAIRLAAKGKTITLLADVADCGSLTISKNITLDGGGHTISGNSSISVNMPGNAAADVTIKNVNFKDIANGNKLSAFYFSQVKGKLTITGCTFDSIEYEAIQVTPMEGAEVNVSNNVFKAKADGTQVRHIHIEMAYGSGFDCEGQNIKLTVTDNQLHGAVCGDASMGIWWVGTGSTLKVDGNYMEHPETVSITLANSGVHYNRGDLIYPARSQADVDVDDLMPAVIVADKASGESKIKAYSTLAEAVAAAEDGQTVTLLADAEQNSQLTIDKSITLDLNGKTISNTVDIWGDNTNAILSIKKGANVTITGNGTIAAKENDCYTINVVNGDLTIENGTFVGNISVVQVQKGSLTINGGAFSLLQKMADGKGENRYLINCIDSTYADGSAKVAISGGTFVGFDPNVSPEQKVDGKAPSFAAPGAGITKNEDGSFTAAAGMTAQILDEDGNSVKAYESLAEAVAAAQDGQTVRLLADVAESSIKVNANITIDLNKMTVTGSFVTYGEVTIQNGTIDVPDGKTNYAYGKLTLADVDITGKAASSSLLSVNYNGSVTIDKNSTIVADSAKGDYPAVFIKGQDDSGKTYAPELNIYGTVQSAKTPAIQGNGTDRGVSHVNVFEGAVVKSESLAVYLPQPCEVNITGGLVEGYCGIGIKSGTLNISGGTVRGVANDNVIGDEYSQTNGISYDGSAIMIDSYIGYAGQVQINISGNAVVESKYSTAIREIGNDKSQTNLVGLDITGGTVLGAKDTDAVLVRDVTAKDVNISGGEFSSIVKKEYCAPGFTPVTTANSEGRYGVEIGKFTVKVTSRTTGSDSPVANVAGGGSDITYAEGTTVTASAISGYNFVGWFVNEYTGTPYSTDLACEVKPTADCTMIAVYEPISGGVFALEVSASKFTVNGGATQRSYLLEKMPIGTQVTVVFKGSENFLYWVNESGKVVSTSKTYTFSMGSATTLKAVYAEKEEHQAMVVFISHTQQVISSKGYTDTQEIQFPEPPIKMGATFVRWSMTEAEIRAAMATTTTGIIVVEPVYEFSAGSYTVTVNYPNDETATYTATVGKITTVTAKSIDGKVFKCWKNGDTVLGYTETLKIAPRGDLTLTAEYVDAGTTVDRLPVIALTEISASQQGAKYAVSFTATRSVPDGYTVTEQGILVSTNSRYGQSDALDAMKLDANGAKPDDTFILKATNTDATGVTVLNGTVSAADRTVYGRAYMILRDSSGAMVYVYSDTILSGSYNSLTTNGGN